MSKRSNVDRDGTARPEVTYLDFKRYFPYTPTALAVRECVRLAKLAPYPCEGPVLDVGCGDGLFARLAFQTDEVWGIDIDANEGRFAQASRAYSQIIIGDITSARLPPGFFKTCVANCSLEHVPNIGAALRSIHDALAPGGVVYLFVPTDDWARHLGAVQLARGAGMEWLARALQSGIDGVFRHHHLHGRDTWTRFCEDAGFEVTEVSEIGSVASLRAFEAFMAPSVLGLLNKKMTGRWTNLPRLRSLASFPAYLAVQAVLRSSSDATRVAELFIAARRSESTTHP
jgi:SAM-dependent methyltransferase